MKILSKIGDAIGAADSDIDLETKATCGGTAVLIGILATCTPWPACLGLWIAAGAVVVLPVLLAIVLDDGLF